MNLSVKSFFGWFGRSAALADTVGIQTPLPGTPLNADTSSIGTDGALQLSAVWACVSLRANIIASLPFFAYKVVSGEKTLARTSRLYAILSDSPNSRMTPFEFWRAMMLNYDLRGNAYARIDRDGAGEAVAIWPMPAEQVELQVLDNGTLVYSYMIGGNIAILASENVFHMKNLGNGTTGLAKLDYMRATMDEAAKAQNVANKVFSNGGKPSGLLMLDRVLDQGQRDAVKQNFLGMSEGNTSRLHLLEANMRYEQLSLSPVEQQLMESRKFSVEEICRWFDVPAVLVNHEGLVKYGNNDVVEDIFYKQVIMPLVENIEQAWRKRVMTSRQRASMACEMGMDALLRGSSAKRAEINAKNVQNGLKTRAEIRQLEGDPFIPGTDVLTAQTNLAPLDMLGKIAASGGAGADIAQ